MSKNKTKKANPKAAEKSAELVETLVKKETDALRVRSRLGAGKGLSAGWCSAPP